MKSFTEDVSQLLLYHGRSAKKSKMTKNPNQGGSCLNFRTANALVLKFGTLPLSGLFFNKLLAIFDIFFRSRVIHRFVPKNGPKLTCGRVLPHNFISYSFWKTFFSDKVQSCPDFSVEEAMVHFPATYTDNHRPAG